ncbi:uncharacterized protein LOC123556402 [Mercenaria mercenaria]|uniref:uncharacterized protein LOC123556402 n=1 Tax=Mercenaria mercenaria TaxID=6596 RepID=UPI00234FA61A|nr:uncharacterized protein LOC123556402 [Mercenaria mercenaria]
MAVGNLSSSTTSLKIAAICLGLVFILHIVGFALPRWSSLTLSADLWTIISVDVSYHVGLWRDCSCASVLGTETCSCFLKISLPEWLKGVRALETLGMIGLLISTIISTVIVCTRQDKTIRGFNILCAGVSGLFIVTGVIIFGIENAEDFEELFSFIESLPIGFDTHGTLAAGFILCTIAGGLCLVVCVPLLVNDYLAPIPTAAQQVSPMTVQYATQGQVIIPPPGQTHVVVNTNQNQLGYMPGYTQAQPGYVQPGQIMQGPPAYAPQFQPSGSQNPRQEQDVPYKS